MQLLYDWIQTQMKTLSRHSDTAKAFVYLLKQWDALNVYCSNGWVEFDNNIAENALRGVAVGRKNGCVTSLNISMTGRQTGYAICYPGKLS